MLLGEFTHAIDTKKRLAIPAKFRKEVGKNVVITRGLDNCLFVFTTAEWKKLADKLGTLPLGQSDARGFSRLMLAGAMEVSVDSLGRILIPDYLKDYASLNKQVIVTGVYNRIEVWDEKIWNLYKKKSEKDAEGLAERLGELGV
ncbi:MAG: division/cell wall cluster transcriptional repressor MraZ [Candidatus Spechtbacterales bacterium]